MRGKEFISCGVGADSRGIEPGRAARRDSHDQVAGLEGVCRAGRGSGSTEPPANSSEILAGTDRLNVGMDRVLELNCAILRAQPPPSEGRTRHRFVKEKLER